MTPEMFIAIAGIVAMPTLAGIVWLVRLEGRVNSHEASCLQRQKQLDERHAEANTKLAAIDQKLDRLLAAR